MGEVDYVRVMPKVDLHRHLDGDVQPRVLLDLAEKEGIVPPARTEIGLSQHFVKLRQEGLGPLFQKGFGFVTSLMQSRENLEIVAQEGVRNLAREGIVYGELRFAPQYHTGESAYYGYSKDHVSEKLTYDDVIEAVVTGVKRGEKEHSVKANVIICIGREAEESVGLEVTHAAMRFKDKGVVAIDLACDEASFPPERHAASFMLALAFGLKRTVHAGEFGPQREKNIMTAFYDLGADRIGQAIPLASMPTVYRIAKYGIGIEMCPESNLTCGFIQSRSELRIPELVGQGVLVSVNSDDPAIFGYTLNQSLYRLMRESRLDMGFLKKLQLNAAQTAFLPDAEKAEIVGKIEAYRVP